MRECEKLRNCDWDSAAILDGNPDDVLWQQTLALCFKDSKDHREGKFDDAVETATTAVVAAIAAATEAATKADVAVAIATDLEAKGGAQSEGTKDVTLFAIHAVAARCVRAYAYYLNGNYEQAIAECKRIDCERKEKKTEKADTVLSQAERFALELLALVYGKLDNPLKANEFCRSLFGKSFTSPESEFFPASPLLMDAYRESVRRLNRR